MNVPVNAPVITDEAKRYVMDALESGWVSSAGEYLQRFEDAFAKYLGVKHAVTVTNGTNALHLSLATLKVGKGDEVILPNFTMGACLSAILMTGARPVFVDVDPETFTMKPSEVERHTSVRTKAIMPVHIYGHPCDMDPIFDHASSQGIPIVEDAAEAHGSTYKGRMCGTLGTLGCFSFYANKIVTTGEGGMVVTDNDELAARARMLRDLAHSPAKRFWHEELGFNYRMTNLQAALGLGQLEHIEEFLEHKRWMSGEYSKRLADIPWLQLPVTKSWATNVHWMYAVLVKPDAPMNKDTLRRRLLERGVDTRDFFYPLSAQPISDPYRTPENYPVTDDIAQRGFYLPSGLALTQEQITYVCDAMQEMV